MMCDCHCHHEMDIVYACSDCPCKTSCPDEIESKYDSYNNCGNCTHNFLQRLWHWQNHGIRISKGVGSQ